MSKEKTSETQILERNFDITVISVFRERENWVLGDFLKQLENPELKNTKAAI